MEWAGAIAPKATIVYAYSNNAFTSLQYAVDQNLGEVVSLSYGSCELYESPAFEAVAQQANAQGITVVVASGDAGAANCDRGNPTPQASTGPAVSFPADFPEVTAVGGSEFNESGQNYWATKNNLSGGSALSYIPETAWNDSVVLNTFAAGGGGPSAIFPKPAWQTGPGVPNDNARDLPDVSLSASWLHDPYMIRYVGNTYADRRHFGSDSVFRWNCRVAESISGFARELRLLRAWEISTRLSTNWRSPCPVHSTTSPRAAMRFLVRRSSAGCVDGVVGFSAGPGYDLASGLGSVDVFNLVTNWNSGAGTTTSVTASPATAGLNDTVQLTATVTGSTTIAPTGTISFILDGVPNAGNLTLATVNLAGSLDRDSQRLRQPTRHRKRHDSGVV